MITLLHLALLFLGCTRSSQDVDTGECAVCDTGISDVLVPGEDCPSSCSACWDACD